MKNSGGQFTVGEKVAFAFSQSIMTIKSFYGESGIEYNSFSEAKGNNPSGPICAKLTTGGSALVKYLVKIPSL